MNTSAAPACSAAWARSALVIALGDARAIDWATKQRADETQVECAGRQGHESDGHKDKPCCRTPLSVAPGDEADAGNQTREATGRAIYELSEAGSAKGFSEAHDHLLEDCEYVWVDHRSRGLTGGASAASEEPKAMSEPAALAC